MAQAELAQAKAAAKATVTGLASLPEASKAEYAGQIDQATSKEAIAEIVKKAQDDNAARLGDKTKKQSIYRLYNPNSGEHFYTVNEAEKNYLVSLGWHDEGVEFQSVAEGVPVYRLYNPNTGDHHYTINKEERDYLTRLGWKAEGVAFYTKGTKPVYRLYNPNAKVGSHFFTQSESEKAHLEKLGWRFEGIAWYTE